MLKRIQKIFLTISMLPIFLFGAGGTNVARLLADKANENIKETTSSIASIVNTISLTMGVLWVVIMLLMYFFNIEAIKNNAKLLAGAVIIIGIVYGLSAYMM